MPITERAPDNCMDCPWVEVLNDPDPDDWFCDDDRAVVCRRTQNDTRNTGSRHASDHSPYKAVTVEGKIIYCCGCGCDVMARLTNGVEIYPQHPDLGHIPFWRCDICGNFVGCHHKTKAPTTPLGCIPTPELRDARKHIHALIDPVWRSGKMGRRELYRAISRAIGREYHTANIRTLPEARDVYRAARKCVQAAGVHA